MRVCSRLFHRRRWWAHWLLVLCFPETPRLLPPGPTNSPSGGAYETVLHAEDPDTASAWLSALHGCILLLRMKTRVEEKDGFALGQCHNSHRGTLHWAAFTGDCDIVRNWIELISSTAASNGESSSGALRRALGKPDTTHGATPLHLAAHAGQRRVTAMLLEAGADPNVKDGAGRTALELAIR
eukprot:SAG31_NODE_2552_length_5509_cov_3.954898_3_plen_183_part_00